MYYIFKTILNGMKNKSIEEILQSKIIKKISGGDQESIRPIIEPYVVTSQFLTNATIKNEVECCYSFDFPKMNENIQKKMFFFYGKEEKAYRTCFKNVKKAYPLATYKVKEGYGHLTYSIKNTKDYISIIRNLLK